MAFAKCPICGDQRNLQYVGNILDKGVTNSSGIGMTIGVGDMGIAPTIMRGSSSTPFVSRFMPPREPGAPTSGSALKWFLIWLLGSSFILSQTWLAGTSNDYLLIKMFISLVFAAPITIVGTILTLAVIFYSTTRQRRGWHWALNRVRNALYCEYDNIVFDYEIAAYPEEYVEHVFRASNPARHALDSRAQSQGAQHG